MTWVGNPAAVSSIRPSKSGIKLYARGVIIPSRALGPSRQSTDQNKDENDDKDSSTRDPGILNKND
jgi:hypothetical protein